MAITLAALSVTFDATNAARTLTGGARRVVGITLQGTGMTAGQRVTVRNKTTVGAGSILADYVTMAATDNADLWGGRAPQLVEAVSLDNTTVGGTWALTVFLEGGLEPAA